MEADYLASLQPISHADIQVIPPLIQDTLVDAGDMNALLGVFQDGEYSPLQCFQMVVAVLFPLWAEIDIPENAQDFPHELREAHAALHALCTVILPCSDPLS
jgi:hypothetical protein